MIYVRNFVRGKYGYSSAVLAKKDDGTLVPFTVFWQECPDGLQITTPYSAHQYAATNEDWLVAMAHDYDGPCVPGWAKNPMTEAEMVERAIKEAGW